MPDTESSAVSETEYETENEVGQDDVDVLGLDVHNPVFFLVATPVVVFVFCMALSGGWKRL